MDLRTYTQKRIYSRTKAIMHDLADFSLVYTIEPDIRSKYLLSRPSYYDSFMENLHRSAKLSSILDTEIWDNVAKELDRAYWLIWEEQWCTTLLPYIDDLICDIEGPIPIISPPIEHRLG